MRAFICSLLLLGACALRPLVLPAQGTNSFAMAKDEGVGLVADATAWNGHPGDLEDFATPVAIELRNDSGRELRFKLSDATLTDDRGQVFRAWQVNGPEQRTQEPVQREPALEPAPPASQPTDSDLSPPPAALKVQTIDAEEDFALVPAVYNPDIDPALVDARGGRGFFGRGSGPAPTVRAPSRGPAPVVRPPSYSRPRGGTYSPPQVYRPGPRYSPGPRFYGRGYYSPYYSPWYSYPGAYWGWGWNNYYYSPSYSYGGTLPPRQDDVVRLAMADTVLEPGTAARGFVYFEHATEQASSLTLRVPVRDASNDSVVTELKTVFFVQR